jgi:hypothetical protein
LSIKSTFVWTIVALGYSLSVDVEDGDAVAQGIDVPL